MYRSTALGSLLIFCLLLCLTLALPPDDFPPDPFSLEDFSAQLDSSLGLNKSFREVPSDPYVIRIDPLVFRFHSYRNPYMIQQRVALQQYLILWRFFNKVYSAPNSF